MSDYYGNGNGTFQFDFNNNKHDKNNKKLHSKIAIAIFAVIVIGAIFIIKINARNSKNNNLVSSNMSESDISTIENKTDSQIKADNGQLNKDLETVISTGCFSIDNGILNIDTSLMGLSYEEVEDRLGILLSELNEFSYWGNNLENTDIIYDGISICLMFQYNNLVMVIYDVLNEDLTDEVLNIAENVKGKATTQDDGVVYWVYDNCCFVMYEDYYINEDVYGYKQAYISNLYSCSEQNTVTIPDDSVEYNGNYYFLFDIDVKSWGEAEEYCENLGGHLAVINSQDENDFLFEYMVSCGYPSAYFGYSDSVEEGNWKSVNGNSSYVNWAPKEPNAENSNEDYAMFYWKYSDGTWNDGDFGDRTNSGGQAFLCEWE